MSKGSFSVYLDRSVELEIGRRAALEGTTKSGWASRALERAVSGELIPFDETLLEQVIRGRAVGEILMELLANERKEQGLSLIEKRTRRYVEAARERIGK